MTDPIAVNAKESPSNHTGLSADSLQASTSLKTFKSRYVVAARVISNVLAPAPISLPLILLVSFYRAVSVASALAYAALTLLFLSIGPFVYIFVGVRTGKLSDLDVSKRAERTGPFLFGLISVCLGWFVLVQIHAPAIIVTCSIITAVSALIMLITTLWWKISIHASSLAGAVTILTALYGAVVLPAFSLVLLVSWSRVVLRRHTVAQVTAGSLLSITLTIFLLKLRGV